MDRRYMAPELLEPERRRELDDQEKRTATFLLPIGIAVGLMAAIAWVFIAIVTPSGKMQTSQPGAGEHSDTRLN
jgi:hypothetical protein